MQRLNHRKSAGLLTSALPIALLAGCGVLTDQSLPYVYDDGEDSEVMGKVLTVGDETLRRWVRDGYMLEMVSSGPSYDEVSVYQMQPWVRVNRATFWMMSMPDWIDNGIEVMEVMCSGGHEYVSEDGMGDSRACSWALAPPFDQPWQPYFYDQAHRDQSLPRDQPAEGFGSAERIEFDAMPEIVKLGDVQIMRLSRGDRLIECFEKRAQDESDDIGIREYQLPTLTLIESRVVKGECRDQFKF